ncbi:hypothetical protein [Blastococcus sp. SYSU DS0533]
MSRIYRAMWHDHRPPGAAPVMEHFAAWVTEKTSGAVRVPEHGGSVTARIPSARGRCIAEVAVEYAGDDQRGLPVRAELVETLADGSRWETTLRAWDEDGLGTWVWVDVEAVGSDRLHETAAAAPRLVRSLLDTAGDPRQGPTRLTTTPRTATGEADGEDLADDLSDPSRTLPVAVFAKDPMLDQQLAGQPFDFDVIVRRAAAQLAGLAVVTVADAAAQEALREALGIAFGVWGGALRLYAPGLDPAVPGDEGRHRVVPSQRYTRYRDLAAHTLARTVGPPAASRRPPSSYEEVRRAMRRRRDAVHDYAELLRIADSDVDRLTARVNALESTIEQQEENIVGLQADLEEAVERASAAETLVERLSRQLMAGEGGTSGRGPDDEVDLLDLRPTSCTEAARLAQQHLSQRLVIPDEALRDLAKLDETLTAAPWGQTAWRGFLALDAYAAYLAEGGQGDFYVWCQSSQHPRAWPATSKKLAMAESQTVSTRKKLRQHRILPAPTAVDPRRRVYMGAHLKIAEGGGPLAPRVYFQVDPKLQKVFIGFFGPHAHMPNKSTN